MRSGKERDSASQIVWQAWRLFLAHMPLLPIKMKWGFYFGYVNKLNDAAYGVFGDKIVCSFPCTKRGSIKYRNTEHEIEAILRLCPRLKKYRGILREYVASRRKHFGLK